jgi:hypothetical protein
LRWKRTAVRKNVAPEVSQVSSVTISQSGWSSVGSRGGVLESSGTLGCDL